ncbi:hypothetical protein H0O00_02950 [Candidatus Micrarchaeota archaeon]|nr:hypothetical protein [Candidatus Micrarchaeota archaeon]
MAEKDARLKKTYRFELKKKYQYVSHYRTKVRPPIEKIKDLVRGILTPKKEKKTEAVLSQAPPGGFNFMVFGAFIFIAIIVLAMGWLFLTTQAFQSAGVFQPPSEKPAIENTIISGDVISSGDRANPRYVASVMIDYNTSNLVNYSVIISTYDQKLPYEVFILNSERFEAGMYPDFIRTLRSNLAKRKIILNEITLKQLETIPEGAIIIVPSGVVPMEMLGVNSMITPNHLADRGVVVIYLGQPFTKMLNGTLVQTTPQATLKTIPFGFDENVQLQTSAAMHVYQPLYRAAPTSGWAGDLKYGSISVATKGDGAFVFLPQTLDGGWRGNYTSAADDVSRIVFDIPWAEPNAPSKNYTFADQTYYAGRSYFFSDQFAKPSVTLKVDFIGYTSTSEFPVRETLFTSIEKERDNDMYIELGGKVVPTNISGKPVRMNAMLREPQAAQPNMYLTMTDSNGTEVQSISQGPVNVQADKSFDVPIYIDRGEYIVALMDDESNIYTQVYMKVVSIDITWKGQDSKKPSRYYFDISMDGQPFELNEISLLVDGGKYGSYTFNRVSSMKVDVGGFTGDNSLPTGDHVFKFTAGGLKVDVPIKHQVVKTIFTDPLFWIMIILTGGIVGIGVLFARQEAIYFALDIPDFPPVARTKIPLAADSILGIFEKINETYRWQCTPLAPTEIKNGFKDIFFHGKPVYITDYNVEFLLDTLEKRNLLKECIGYYGLISWEDRTKHSIEYLALMRRLRDICVNNAIPFTQLDESKEADSVLTVVGQQMYLHFYEKGGDPKELLKRILPSIGHGISIVVFKSMADKSSFQGLINSSPSVAPLITKMELDSSSLLLLTTEELEKMLIEFKSM